jgi:hypothetical protein
MCTDWADLLGAPQGSEFDYKRRTDKTRKIKWDLGPATDSPVWDFSLIPSGSPGECWECSSN